MPPQSPEAATVEAAEQVLNDIMAIPFKAIPQSLLSDAQGIAIVPGMIKAGFVIGVRRGHGVLVCRDAQGDWQLPEFITVTGGSVGWQAGIQGTDLVLVFRTQRSLQGLASGKVTVGADVAAAAGPVGRSAAAATDLGLKAEILSYSRSRGLFAGVAIDGSAIEMDRTRTVAYYRAAGDAAPGQSELVPAEAVKLLGQITKYSAPAAGTTPAAPESLPVEPAAPTTAATREAQALRLELGESASRLQALVDDQWKRYLALPAEIYAGDHPPSAAALNSALERYHTVATIPQYRALSRRPEFQTTWALLQKYQAVVSAPPSTPLALPPPPK
jgi:lipid-binding SYLF domain-containing protein